MRAALTSSTPSRRGFTLIEALVAFTILTLVMSQLLEGAGGGARNDARADFLLRAVREGRSQLDALGVETPISVGEQTGRYPDGLLWRLTVEPYRETQAASGLGRTAAYLARLTVRRPNGTDALTLTTVRLVSSGVAQ
jgi:hypothetical protein